MCLLGRAANIFPLALLCNKFREHKITKKMMFIMWFSGMFFQSKRYNNEIVISTVYLVIHIFYYQF